MRTRSTLICSVSALFCASSSTSSSFRLSLSSESSVSGGIPNLNQPPVMRSMPKARVKPTQRGEQLRKKTRAGERERVAALIARGFPESFLQIEPARLGVGRDGFLDACAALWTAERIYDGAANRFPRTVERDPRGLDMAMWY